MLAEVQGRLQQNIAVLRQAQATGSQPKPTQRQQGGYITWVGARVGSLLSAGGILHLGHGGKVQALT